jgi:hypothetical protein
LAELRRLFNNYVLPRAHRGEFRIEIVSDGVPSPRIPEPPGTRSQKAEYWLGDERYALVHYYLRPDGSIGQSGLPDPKNICHDGQRHAPHKEPPQPHPKRRRHR